MDYECSAKFGRPSVNQSDFPAIACRQCLRFAWHLSDKQLQVTASLPAIFQLNLLQNDQRTFSSACNSVLSESRCDKLLKCCTDAVACCEQQIQDQHRPLNTSQWCPPVWDGFACWNRTEAGTVVSQPCPEIARITTSTSGERWIQILRANMMPMLINSAFTLWCEAVA